MLPVAQFKCNFVAQIKCNLTHVELQYAVPLTKSSLIAMHATELLSHSSRPPMNSLPL